MVQSSSLNFTGVAFGSGVDAAGAGPELELRSEPDDTLDVGTAVGFVLYVGCAGGTYVMVEPGGVGSGVGSGLDLAPAPDEMRGVGAGVGLGADVASGVLAEGVLTPLKLSTVA